VVEQNLQHSRLCTTVVRLGSVEEDTLPVLTAVLSGEPWGSIENGDWLTSSLSVEPDKGEELGEILLNQTRGKSWGRYC